MATEVLRDHPHVLHLTQRHAPRPTTPWCNWRPHDYLDFWWTPDVTTYRKARDWMGAQHTAPNRELPSVADAVHALDLLDLLSEGAVIVP